MKHKILLIVPIISGLTLTSCGLIDDDSYLTEVKTANIYKAAEVNKGTIYQLDELKTGEINYRYYKSQPLIPYLSFKGYETLVKTYFNEYAVSSFVDKGYVLQWTVSMQVASSSSTSEPELPPIPVFTAQIDLAEMKVTYTGSFSSVFKAEPGSSPDPADYLKGVSMSQKTLNPNEITMTTISFKEFRPYKMNIAGNMYLPLGYLDHLFSKAAGKSIYNTYKDFFIVGTDYNALEYTKFKVDESSEVDNILTYTKKNVMNQISERVTVKVEEQQLLYPLMPMYLRNYHRDSLSFTFENFYGIKYSRGIKSMTDYIKNYSFYDDFLSADPIVRAEALSDYVASLNDGHTSIQMKNSVVWGEYIANRKWSPMWEERIKLRSDLTTVRNAAYTLYDYNHATSQAEREAILSPGYEPDQYSVKYSDDGKLAFFYFNDFLFSKVDHTDPDLYKKDTFSYFVRQFEEIKSTSVTDVVIDLSTNGGGIIIALMKILALISKNNLVDVDQFNQDRNALTRITVSVDTNEDQKFDENDVYGNRFNFYLLCSPFSFSCGNAYPFCAYKENLATIIGTRSGGGECAVGNTMLSSGQFINHSSLTRLGHHNAVLNEQGQIDHYEFEGNEAGAPVEEKYQLNYSYYYDFNYLSALIQSNKNA